MAKSKLIAANKKIENSVVGGYKKIEDGVVGGFTKMSDGFVDQFLTKDGESIEDAKNRLKEEKKKHEIEVDNLLSQYQYEFEQKTEKVGFWKGLANKFTSLLSK